MADIDNLRRERKLKKNLNLLFDAVMIEVFRKLVSDDRKKSEFEIDLALGFMTGAAFLKLYQDTIMNMALQAAQAGQNKTIMQIKNSATPAAITAQYKALSPQTRNLIERSVFEASQLTLNRLKGDVKQVLLDAYDQGKGTQEIARDLKAQFVYMKNFESERIARTEMNSFSNEAGFIAKTESNIQYHMWVTSADERVRSSHRSIDGEIVKVGDRFSNGLRYPGDKSGPIGEWINCRCIARAYFIPEGYSFPLNKKIFRESDLINVKK